MRVAFLMAAVAVLGGLAGRAHAQRPAPALPSGVRIALAKCERIVARKALLEQLRVELLSTGVVEIEVVDPATAATQRRRPTKKKRLATLHMYFPECGDSAGLVYLRISDRLTAKYVERAMDVSDVARSARARAIALAIVELLRASWLELVLQPDSWEQETGPAPAVREGLVTRLKEAAGEEAGESARATRRTARAPASEAELLREWRKTRLEWTANMRIYPQGGAGLVSTDLSVSVAMGKRLRLAVGGRAGGGGVRDAYDDVNLFAAAGRLSLLLSTGGDPQVELQSGLEAGWAQATGNEPAGRGGVGTRDGVVMNALLAGTLRTAVAKALDLLISLQAGFMLAPLLIKVGPSDVPAGSAFSSELLQRRVGGLVGPSLGISIGLSGRL